MIHVGVKIFAHLAIVRASGLTDGTIGLSEQN